MDIEGHIQAAVLRHPEAVAGRVAVNAVRDFVRQDTDVAHRVAQYTSLRQAAGETPIKFVRRIVSTYLSEAVGAGWPEEADNDNGAA